MLPALPTQHDVHTISGYAGMLLVGQVSGVLRDQTAKAAGLSLADAMRQSLKLGLPKLREQLATPSPKPFTPEEAREAFAPDPEWDAITSAMSRLPIVKIEE